MKTGSPDDSNNYRDGASGSQNDGEDFPCALDSFVFPLSFDMNLNALTFFLDVDVYFIDRISSISL